MVIQEKRKSVSGKPRLSQFIYDYVVENISKGQFSPGTKLAERKLAEKLGTSHVPVREALEKLEQRGFVYRLPRRGAFVAEFDLNSLKSFYQIREIIEVGAIYHITPTLNDHQLHELKKITELLKTAGETKDAEVFATADIQFHKLIVHFTGNQKLEEFFNSILAQASSYFMVFWVNAMRFFMKTGKKAGFLDPLTHIAIYDAIAANNTEKAVKLVRKHIKNGFSVISKIIQLNEELKKE